MDYLLSGVIGYLLGSVSCGLLLVKLICGIDIRDYGSHNIGATNVFRTVGARMASFVLLGDLLKGVLALYLVNHYVSSDLTVLILCATCAILGHSFPGCAGSKEARVWPPVWGSCCTSCRKWRCLP